MLSLDQFIDKINNSTYKLDSIGVVGLFGGDRAADALQAIHLFQGRMKWVGWYNYPGGTTVAMRFGQMARGIFWDTIFPGPNESPAVTFNIAGKLGPDYFGVFSGTRLQTKYLGYLIVDEVANSPGRQLQLVEKDGMEGRRTGSSSAVSIISLSPIQREKVSVSVSGSRMLDVILLKPIPIVDRIVLWSTLTSVVSILACVFSFLGHDPLCASLILLGILTSGFSSVVLGSATLGIRVPAASLASPPEDGLMFLADGSIIVLKGMAPEVDIITKGEFELEYAPWVLWPGTYQMVGISSLLSVAQVLIQFALLPRCTFFGQILALISFLASGMYHLRVISLSPDRERLHRKILLQGLSMRMEKWIPGTRTQTAVFVCLVLGDGHAGPLKFHPDTVLSRIIPNETAVWRYWRKKVVKELERFWGWDADLLHLYVPSVQVEPEDQTDKGDYSHFTGQDIRLLNDLIDDAWCVFSRYSKWGDSEPGIWRDRGDVAKEDQETRLRSGGSPA